MTEKKICGAGNGETTFNLPNIGLGTMRTSATYAALFILLEGDRENQIDVLDSVMKALNIAPEEILHNRKMPDVCDEAAWRKWNNKKEAIIALNNRY
ncbi:hypothetical protein [Desulfobulbus elongatus]|uniref:hypothetical protein n=1 Tax=Desulfobulbus elongatus TaxID=53332 RepID=UPI00146FAAC7|nr:hypothetical protein [Desulfobulbus elongatus]